MMSFIYFSVCHISTLRSGSDGVNSLAPGRYYCKFKLIIFKFTSQKDILSISCEMALWWIPQDLPDGQSTLVQVMAWCCQSTSHYPIQCWPRFMSAYGDTKQQCFVNSLWLRNAIQHKTSRFLIKIGLSNGLLPQSTKSLPRSILTLMINKIWRLCLVPTSTTRFASKMGYRMAKI